MDSKDSKPVSGGSSINFINSKPKNEAKEEPKKEVAPVIKAPELASNPFMANKKPEAAATNPFLKAGGSTGFAAASNPFVKPGDAPNAFAAKPFAPATNAFAAPAASSPFTVTQNNFKPATPGPNPFTVNSNSFKPVSTI